MKWGVSFETSHVKSDFKCYQVSRQDSLITIRVSILQTDHGSHKCILVLSANLNHSSLFVAHFQILVLFQSVNQAIFTICNSTAVFEFAPDAMSVGGV